MAGSRLVSPSGSRERGLRRRNACLPRNTTHRTHRVDAQPRRQKTCDNKLRSTIRRHEAGREFSALERNASQKRPLVAHHTGCDWAISVFLSRARTKNAQTHTQRTSRTNQRTSLLPSRGHTVREKNIEEHEKEAGPGLAQRNALRLGDLLNDSAEAVRLSERPGTVRRQKQGRGRQLSVELPQKWNHRRVAEPGT